MYLTGVCMSAAACGPAKPTTTQAPSSTESATQARSAAPSVAKSASPEAPKYDGAVGKLVIKGLTETFPLPVGTKSNYIYDGLYCPHETSPSADTCGRDRPVKGWQLFSYGGSTTASAESVYQMYQAKLDSWEILTQNFRALEYDGAPAVEGYVQAKAPAGSQFAYVNVRTFRTSKPGFDTYVEIYLSKPGYCPSQGVPQYCPAELQQG